MAHEVHDTPEAMGLQIQIQIAPPPRPPPSVTSMAQGGDFVTRAVHALGSEASAKKRAGARQEQEHMAPLTL